MDDNSNFKEVVWETELDGNTVTIDIELYEGESPERKKAVFNQLVRDWQEIKKIAFEKIAISLNEPSFTREEYASDALMSQAELFRISITDFVKVSWSCREILDNDTYASFGYEFDDDYQAGLSEIYTLA